MKFGTKKMKMTNKGTFEKHGKSHACRLCGQYIEPGQEFFLIVVPLPWAKTQRNFFVHAEEWEQHCEELELPDEIFGKLAEIVQPKSLNKTQVDLDKVEAFRRVLRKRGCLITKETSFRIYFKMSKNTANFYFDKRFNNIEFTGRRFGLFDRLFLNETISRLNEDWCTELRQPIESVVRAETVFQEATDRVNEIMR